MKAEKSMSVLPISAYGDKILRKKAVKVTAVNTDLIKLIKDMFDTMNKANGIGLAATQVGSDKSVFVIDISAIEGHEESRPMAFINPKITYRSKELKVIEEGCLSIPGLRFEVERPESVKITFQDVNMEVNTIEASDILARVIQHEYDHLQGVLFIDRLNEGERKELKKELDMIKKRQIDVDYPITEKTKVSV